MVKPSGLPTTVDQGGQVTTFSYNGAAQLLGESRAGLAVTKDYNAFAQRTVVALPSQASTLTGFAYDALGRLEVVANGQEQFTYSYLDNTRLVTRIIAKHGGVLKPMVTRKYDRLNRLVEVNTTPSGGPPLTFSYQYNAANERIRSTLADGSYWANAYDGLGQVKSGKRRWSDGAPVPGQQFEYAFDQIGNRSSTKAGGDDRGAALRAASYTANRLNQYESRQVPGWLDVVGIARADAVVEVNGATEGVYRHAEYFDKALSLDNSSAPVWATATVEATWNSQTDTRSGHAWLPQTPESFDYDEDGNLKTDGRWTFTWDGEDRLTRLVARTATGPQQRIDFGYDWRGRRISKKVWNNTEGTGNPAVDLRFAYDGWNLLAILASDLTPLTSFVWGVDLSGSEQGAGGVGGLLAVVNSPSGLAHYAAYDGNGNVVALIQATDGALSARYEYGPFGEPIRVSGPMASANPIRWSTKYTDEETDFVYYGLRYSGPSFGRWLSPDPIGVRGGKNLYGFVGNNSLTRIDRSGLDVIELPTAPPSAPPQLPPSRFTPPTEPDLPRLRPRPKLTGTKCCPKPSGGAALGLGLTIYFASTETLNRGEDDALAYLNWLGELKAKCKKFPKNLDDCLDDCDEEGLAGQALKDCYCKCWKTFPPTPRNKSRDQLIEEWNKTHPGQKWPNEPEFPDWPQIPHHLWPVKDGGADDGGRNIEPLPRKDHIDLHRDNDDWSRWGKRSHRRCDGPA